MMVGIEWETGWRLRHDISCTLSYEMMWILRNAEREYISLAI